MAKSRYGNDSTRSTKRAMMVSAMPPRKPAAKPSTAPMTTVEQGGHHPDEQRDPSAVGQPDEDVSALVVGAQEEGPARCHRQPVRAEAGLRNCSLTPCPVIAANTGAKIATRTMITMTQNEMMAARSCLRRAQASCQVLRPSILAAVSSSTPSRPSCSILSIASPLRLMASPSPSTRSTAQPRPRSPPPARRSAPRRRSSGET